MIITLKYTKRLVLLLLMAVLLKTPLRAQWFVQESVLSDHTWYKIGVLEEGVYCIDYAALQSFGVDVQNVAPARIRLFGNEPGVLPEENFRERYDDLSEIAIQVTGSEDGSFDEDDKIFFYANGPVSLKMNNLGLYEYSRNPYTDTIFYFLCVDSDASGLRIREKASVQTTEGAPVITSFLDCIYHESDELSVFASGRTWYGDLITAQEGYKDFVYETPDLVEGNAVWIDSKVLGRTKKAFPYSLRLNGLDVVDAYSIGAYSTQNHEYGKEHSVRRAVVINEPHLALRYEILDPSSNPMLFIDYFNLSFWRGLRFRGKELAFQISPAQMETASIAKVEVEDVPETVRCWDVTYPMLPFVQMTERQSGLMSFGIQGLKQHRFVLFDTTEVKHVSSCYPIHHQNLHGISDAEYLIITPRVFWGPSESLAEFHREKDQMDCMVVDVAEIFNEFGTGIPDPTAIRDFIRMVYLRSNGNLKYVLLMGKGTHDYRNIKGVDNNFVPTYEILATPFLEVFSMCSDDYYALMDESEGKDCEGVVDIGIGRIPITTAAQGEGVVEKIKHYADLSQSHGPWKNNHLLMADNDQDTYAKYAENLDRTLDTACPRVTTKKLYLDSYPLVNTPYGERIPQAHDDLMDYLETGVGVLSYTGHGGIKALATECVIANSDIQALENFDKLPFVHTATCEFSKFDNPTIVSAGELMILNPRGGAIALLTSMRPTHAQTNQVLSLALHQYLYDKVDRNNLRFGDIFRFVKGYNYKKGNIVYVLFGDPALRFACPTSEVITESLEGNGILTVNGYVAGDDSGIDTLFNGLLDVTLYDQKSRFTTLSTLGATPVRYAFHKDVLFEGKAYVTKGRFSFELPVPADIGQGNGTARLSYYAFDSIRELEANGVYDGIVLDSMSVVDLKGPDIHLYWNTPDFVNGETVTRRGVLYADLFDEHGIYHYNVSIGRNLILKSNLPGYDNLNLNSQYEPAVNDFRRGRVALPIGELEDGTYEFSLKAWDTQNNASEVEITFEVRQGALMAQVHNSPNPFTGETWFTFLHGDMTDHLSVMVEVFDLMGRKVASFQKETDAFQGVVEPICWNGSALRSGIYVYRLTVTNSEGKTSTIHQRMIKN